MTTIKSKRTRGFFLAFVMLMVAVLAMMGGALVSLTSGSLVSVRQSVQAERALALADAGLVTATAALTTGNLPNRVFENFPGEGNFEVDHRVNSGSGSIATPWGITLPPKSTLLRSRGTTVEGTQRTSYALFRSSLGAFQVGALADQINATDSIFDAYDSSQETAGHSGTSPDPASLIDSTVILASNRTTGQVINLTSTNVSGSVFVGGNAGSQILLDDSEATTTGVLERPIELPPIQVPNVANGGTQFASDSQARPSAVRLKDPSGKTDTTITPPASQGSPITLSHYCLTVKVWPDGRFWAEEGGSGSRIQGDIGDRTVRTLSSASGGRTPLQVLSYEPLEIRGNWHHMVYNPANSSVAIDQNGIRSPAPAPRLHSDMPPWMFFSSPPPTQDDPTTLDPGKYDTVNIQNTMTSLVDGGVYVVKNLRVNSNGKIYLGSEANDTKIFVTGSLEILGQDAIVNDSRKPTALKIYYTGTQPVVISGGASAFASLYAPNAPVTLEGFGASFFGAIAANRLIVNQAEFHYDVATQGVGTGVDSNTFQLLARFHQ